MINPTGYKLNPDKLKGAPHSILPYLLSSFYFTEEFEYFDLVKPYLDIPKPPKTLEEISQEFDEKIDELIETTKWKFAYSKEGSEKRYNTKFNRIIENFEYAKEHGSFPPKLTITGLGGLDGTYLISSGNNEVEWASNSYALKQGNNHKGYYTFGNRRYFKIYMPDKPNHLVRFFMKTCLGFVWVDEKNG